MFQAFKNRPDKENRLRGWLRWTEDILGDPQDDVLLHPHRRELRWERSRRPGAVPPRPAHCISPVRTQAAREAAAQEARLP